MKPIAIIKIVGLNFLAIRSVKILSAALRCSKLWVAFDLGDLENKSKWRKHSCMNYKFDFLHSQDLISTWICKPLCSIVCFLVFGHRFLYLLIGNLMYYTDRPPYQHTLLWKSKRGNSMKNNLMVLYHSWEGIRIEYEPTVFHCVYATNCWWGVLSRSWASYREGISSEIYSLIH